MGGGAYGPPPGHHYYKEVWSWSGGWWADPKHWRRNTAVAFAGFAAVGYFIFNVSAENEQRLLAPKGWIPSMMWAKNMPKAPAAEE